MLDPTSSSGGGGCGRTKRQTSARSPASVGAKTISCRLRECSGSPSRTDLIQFVAKSCMAAEEAVRRSRAVALMGGSRGSIVMKRERAEAGTSAVECELAAFSYPRRMGGIESSKVPSILPLRYRVEKGSVNDPSQRRSSRTCLSRTSRTSVLVLRIESNRLKVMSDEIESSEACDQSPPGAEIGRCIS